MRIVGGQFQGRTIVAPQGHDDRLGTDGARGLIFNVLVSAEWSPGIEERRVLDLFAGSGALGFEAMSRGAAFALFVETGAAARGAIRDNIEALGLFGNTRIHRRDATDLGLRPAGLSDPFDLIFLDPPHGEKLGERALARLGDGGWITQDALIVLAVDETLNASAYETLDEQAFGAAKVIFLKPR